MTHSPILNIAGYKFVPLNGLMPLREELLQQTKAYGLRGTILLSQEGININLAGDPLATQEFAKKLTSDSRFVGIHFHQTYSSSVPFKTLKIKIKNEIITMRQPKAMPSSGSRAAAIAPEMLKQWLDEDRDITLLDTRNDYEFRFGTFVNALNLQTANFGELPTAIAALNRTKPLVMFCTGGIRCEKAAIYMQNEGFSEVYQLDGGILGYFSKVGGAHFKGECFVFDKRISLTPELINIGTTQCIKCQGPIFPDHPCPICF